MGIGYKYIRKSSAYALTLMLGLGACTALESNRAGTPFLDANGRQKATQFVGTYSLPRRYLNFEILGTDTYMHLSDAFNVKRDPSADAFLPDPSGSFRYEINYTPSRFSRDEVDVKVDQQILQSVTVATDDQTGKALVNLAEALGRITRLTQGIGLPTPGSGTERGLAIDKTVGRVQLDPTDPASLARVRKLLRGHLTVDVTPPPRPVAVIPACNYAICFRPLTSVVVTFKSARSGNVIEFTASVPDPHQISGIDIERSPFVRRDTIVTFADGSPKSVDLTKPSEVAAAVLLPLEIVDAVFKGVNTAVQSLLGLQKNELDAQAKLLTAQADFLKALAAYRSTLDQTFPEGLPNGVDAPQFTPAAAAPTPSAAATQDPDRNEDADEDDSPTFEDT